MYDHVKNKPRPKRDRMLLAALLAVAAVIGALIPPVYMALGASYKYHEFVLTYAQSLTAAREERGVITLTLETGEQKRVSADDVSAAFVTLTGFGFGQPVKKTPDVPALTVTLPDAPDREAVEAKEHIGYIVDRTGFEEFLNYIMKDVKPNPECEIQGRLYWGGKRYDQTNELRNSMFRFSEREE